MVGIISSLNAEESKKMFGVGGAGPCRGLSSLFLWSNPGVGPGTNVRFCITRQTMSLI